MDERLVVQSLADRIQGIDESLDELVSAAFGAGHIPLASKLFATQAHIERAHAELVGDDPPQPARLSPTGPEQ